MKRKFLLNFSICQLVAHFLRYSVSNFLRWLVVHVFYLFIKLFTENVFVSFSTQVTISVFRDSPICSSEVINSPNSNFREMKNYTLY